LFLFVPKFRVSLCDLRSRFVGYVRWHDNFILLIHTFPELMPALIDCERNSRGLQSLAHEHAVLTVLTGPHALQTRGRWRLVRKLIDQLGLAVRAAREPLPIFRFASRAKHSAAESTTTRC